MGKGKIKRVYCPDCGDVVEAVLLNCPRCKASLNNAAEADSSEEKTHKKRMRRDKRERRREAHKAKREALFAKAPFLEPLYYGGIGVGIIVGLILLGKLFMVNALAGAIVSLALFVPIYLKVTLWVVDNFESYSGYRRGRGKPMWGFVVGGMFIIVSLLCLIYSLLFD